MNQALVRPRVVIVDGVPMSGLLAEAADPTGPKATVVALHGGGTSSSYFDCPGHPQLSLLRLGATLGFTVVALDRPGHGSSAPYPEAMQHPEQRVDLAFGAIDRMLDQRPRGAGLFLMGHSGGCELVLRMATSPRAADLLGVELGGTGRRYHPAAKEVMRLAALQDRPPGVRELLWEPMHLYPDDIRRGITNSSTAPRYERTVALNWPNQDFPALAPGVRVPVRFTLGEHDNVFRADPSALAEIADMFSAAEYFVNSRHPGAGHNLSLGHTAADYHRKVLSFVEDCASARPPDGDAAAAAG
ncbi:Alpha/beta hydrolase family protein [Mycobacterium marinum]|uniref:Alpha/beta hydrolase family protein n=1 Tax=Mycobacterium marinum TaxID=1781 RepID=A0A3E2MSW4_MYCMR|nr:alpha/beta hydrolase [Mycobacterium marinum]RFZ37910.1 Alpha/beta hydrolase family protein [Mycobacterium marinum]